MVWVIRPSSQLAQSTCYMFMTSRLDYCDSWYVVGIDHCSIACSLFRMQQHRLLAGTCKCNHIFQFSGAWCSYNRFQDVIDNFLFLSDPLHFHVPAKALRSASQLDQRPPSLQHRCCRPGTLGRPRSYRSLSLLLRPAYFPRHLIWCQTGTIFFFFFMLYPTFSFFDLYSTLNMLHKYGST